MSIDISLHYSGRDIELGQSFNILLFFLIIRGSNVIALSGETIPAAEKFRLNSEINIPDI